MKPTKTCGACSYCWDGCHKRIEQDDSKEDDEMTIDESNSLKLGIDSTSEYIVE